MNKKTYAFDIDGVICKTENSDYENSVPNPWVLALSLQQSDQSRECSVKIKDPELLHADRDPRTAMQI